MVEEQLHNDHWQVEFSYTTTLVASGTAISYAVIVKDFLLVPHTYEFVIMGNYVKCDPENVTHGMRPTECDPHK